MTNKLKNKKQQKNSFSIGNFFSSGIVEFSFLSQEKQFFIKYVFFFTICFLQNATQFFTR